MTDSGAKKIAEPWMREAAKQIVDANADRGRTYDNSPDYLETAQIIAEHAPGVAPQTQPGTCPTCQGFVNICGHSKMRVYSERCNDGSGMSMTICGPCQSASNSVTMPAAPKEGEK